MEASLLIWLVQMDKILGLNYFQVRINKCFSDMGMIKAICCISEDNQTNVKGTESGEEHSHVVQLDGHDEVDEQQKAFKTSEQLPPDWTLFSGI